MPKPDIGRDTIFALSSGRGRAGVAVIRVSGPKAGETLQILTQAAMPMPRLATRRTISGADGSAIDQALALWFPSPASFTGEDVVEFHVHGGRAVIDAVLGALGDLEGLRLAEAGEFTRRAVENGKFDLTRAEALADLINAETEAQRRQALRQYGGALADLYEGWRDRLIHASAWAEAAIDFADEDIPATTLAGARQHALEIAGEIRMHLNDSRRGEILRDGFHLAVVGPPNSGKSSLVNALARRDVAIVSDIPGTTRDVLEVHLDLAGYPVIVADTAGLRVSTDAIEAEGVRRALSRASEADAVLLLRDASAPDLSSIDPLIHEPALTVWNKADLPHPARDGLMISVRTGEGIDGLLTTISALVHSRLEGERPALSRERHRRALLEAEAALRRSANVVAAEIFAEELRRALCALGRITGRVDIEELLDAVFRDFCIGK